MYFGCLVLALGNSYFCWSSMASAHAAGSLTALAWALLFYFSLLMIFQLHGGLTFTEGFTGYSVEYSYADIVWIYAFVLACNVSMRVGQHFASRALRVREFLSPEIKGQNVLVSLLSPVMLVLFLIGGVIYYFQGRNLGYSGFVEYEGSNWGLVLLYCSSSLICFYLLRGKYYVAAALVTVYVYFSFVLQIRSFFLFSVFVVIAVFYLKNIAASGSVFGGSRNARVSIIAAVLAMLAMNFAISYGKTGAIVLPESGLVGLMTHVIYKLSSGYPLTGLDSTERFLYGLYKPIAAVIGYAPNLSEDVQVYFARLIFGFESWDQFYHYPSLWYADAYSSLGYAGFLFGIVWGVWFVTIEKLIRQNKVLFCMFLPLFLWNMYMVMRGAVGNSTAAISFPIYINCLLYASAYLLGSVMVRGREPMWKNQNR